MGSIKKALDLTGKTALITGGSRGLGLQIAEALGEQGARIVLSSRKAADLQEAQKHLSGLDIEANWIAADNLIDEDVKRACGRGDRQTRQGRYSRQQRGRDMGSAHRGSSQEPHGNQSGAVAQDAGAVWPGRLRKTCSTHGCEACGDVRSGCSGQAQAGEERRCALAGLAKVQDEARIKLPMGPRPPGSRRTRARRHRRRSSGRNGSAAGRAAAARADQGWR